MTVEDIMTRDLIACHPDTDIGTAARLMLDGRVGTLPVTDPHGRLAGIITDRDIAMAAATRQRNAAHITVHEAMSERVRTCAPGDDVGAALRLMGETRVRRLPVVDASGRLAGILSIDDIVSRAVNEPGGVRPVDLVTAMQRICSRLEVEPDMDWSDTLTAG